MCYGKTGYCSSKRFGNEERETGLPCSIITDAGDTEFHGVPTKTTVGIGPDESEKIDVITGNLKLL